MTAELQTEFRNELHAIADWWIINTLDESNDGFIGEINNENTKMPEANKGIILNARILWFFSEVARFSGGGEKLEKYSICAQRAYEYLLDYFVDQVHGGVYWELSAQAEVLNDRKQVYAQAFVIYGLSSYYKLTHDENALNLAYKIFEIIELNAVDKINGGYIEAFNRDWSELKDYRLSEKDLNSPKSMNTHLHVLEAYTNLYAADKHRQVGDAIRCCLNYFDRHIIDHQAKHLRMFQTMAWKDISDSYSYGHDIESSWLIWEALECLGDNELKKHFKPIVLSLIETCLQQAIGGEGEMWDSYNYKTDTLHEERVWWVQAEALVGFLTAYNLSNEQKYYVAAKAVWQFIKKHQKDHERGEWHWLSKLDLPKTGDYKMGFWKAPYHNGRAMLEAIRLV